MNEPKTHTFLIERPVPGDLRRRAGFLAPLLVCALLLPAFSRPGLAGEIEALRATLNEKLPNTEITFLRKSAVPGLFEVVAGENIFYVDSTGDQLIIGHLYNLNSYKDLTAGRLARLGYAPKKEKASGTPSESIPWDKLPGDAAIVENKGGKYRLATFSDINCPHCKRLAAILDDMPDVEVHTYLVSLWPQSSEPARAVLCASDRAAALRAAYAKSFLPPVTSCASDALDRNNAFAAFHGITGTPFLVRSDGRTLSGGRSKAFLLDWLKEARR